jgi:putative transcriptional regulator
MNPFLKQAKQHTINAAKSAERNREIDATVAREELEYCEKMSALTGVPAELIGQPVKSPDPLDIREIREAAGLTQSAAAELIHSKRRTWQDWELGIAAMHPGLWELFLLKIK